jgi:hypothetical protein
MEWDHIWVNDPIKFLQTRREKALPHLADRRVSGDSNSGKHASSLMPDIRESCTAITPPATPYLGLPTRTPSGSLRAQIRL